MVRRISFARRAAGVSYEEFQSHWRGPHAELARRLPGVRRYVQNHAVLGPGGPLLGYPGFDVCADLTFADMDAVHAALTSPEYRASAIADQEGFSDMTHLSSMIIESAIGPETEPDPGAVKLMTFMRRSAQFERARFADALLGPYAAAPAAGAVARELLLAAEGPDPIPAFDAVDTLWFEDLEAAVRFPASSPAQSARWELGGLVAGVERLVARELRVS